MTQAEAYQLLSSLFEYSRENLNEKKQAISNIDITFKYLTKDNFEQFIDFIIEWTVFQINPECFEAFLPKIQYLQQFMIRNCPQLQERIIRVLFYYLQQQDIKIRQMTIPVIVDILKLQTDQSFLRKSIFQLLKDQNYCSGYDSALMLFIKFRKYFDKPNQIQSMINHSAFKICFKTKKQYLLRLLEMFSNPSQQIQQSIIIQLYKCIPSYIKQQDEVIHTLAIKLRIIVLYHSLKRNHITYDDSVNQIRLFYEDPLIRTRFILIQMTEYIRQILPPHYIRRQYEFLESNIKSGQSQIMQFAIGKLKYLFSYLLKQQRKLLLKWLIKLDKQDHHVCEAVAKNIIQLLIEQQNQDILVQCLKQFVIDQKDIVKLSLMKSFFDYEKSNHWYNFLLHTLNELMQNKAWRIRLQSIDVLSKVVQIASIQSSMFPILKKLLFDKVAKIRSDTVKLFSKCIYQEDIQKQLVGPILLQTKNTNYLYRQTVLFFIKQTYSKVPQEILNLYKQSLNILKQDPIQNVKDIALQILKL